MTVYKLVCQGTVETQMLSRIEKKQYMASQITEAMHDGQSGSSTLPSCSSEATDTPEMGTEELSRIIRNSLRVLSHPTVDVDEMIGWDLYTTLSKCTIATKDLRSVDSGQAFDKETKEAWLTKSEHVTSRLFEGEIYKKVNRKKPQETDTTVDAGDRAARRAGKERREMIDGFWVSKDSLTSTETDRSSSVSTSPRPKKAIAQYQTVCSLLSSIWSLANGL